MNGEHPLEALSAYLDGELDAGGRRALERHLEACAECAALLADLRRMAEVSREETIPPVPVDLGDRILERLPARRRGGLLFRVPMAAAATLAAMALLWIVWIRDPGLQPDPMRSRSDPMESREAPGMQREIARRPPSLADDEAGRSVSPPPAMPGTEQGLAQPQAVTAPPGEPSTATEGDASFAQSRDRKTQGPAGADEAGSPVSGAIQEEDAPAVADADAAGSREEELQREEAARRLEEAARMAKLAQGRGQAAKSEGQPSPQEAPADETASGDLGLVPRARPSMPSPAPASALLGKRGMPEPRLYETEEVLPAGTWLLVDPDYSIRLDPDGSLRLRSGTFSCSLPPGRTGHEDVAFLARMAAEAIAAETPSAAASPQRVGSASAPASTEAADGTGAMVLQVIADGGAVAVAPDAAPEVAARLQALAGRRYTPDVEATCGELPAALREVIRD